MSKASSGAGDFADAAPAVGHNRAVNTRAIAAFVVAALGAVFVVPSFAQDAASRPASRPAETEAEAFFRSGRAPAFAFDLDADAVASLRREPRAYVRATLRVRDALAPAPPAPATTLVVAIKLKGSAGSFQEFHEKPGLTVDVDRFVPGATWNGLRKFHLNNGAQDGSYLREGFAYGTFRLAGYPAPLTTHATVVLAGRDLGLYVLKEPYDRGFLARSFGDDAGNLYDGGVNGDVFDELERDEGEGALDRADLKRVAAACEEPDLDRRRERLRAAVDLPRALDFMALECLVDHWDGYTRNPNNYRLYFPRATGRGVFVPHGTDQVFRDADAPLFDPPNGRVAAALFDDPEFRVAYRARVKALSALLVPPEPGLARLAAAADRLRPVVARTRPPDEAGAWEGEVAGFAEALRRRAAFLAVEASRPEPRALAFGPDGAALDELVWRPRDADGVAYETRGEGAARTLVVRHAGEGPSVGSWRASTLLSRGKYTLVATLTARNVVARPRSDAAGAGVRISGGRRRGYVVGAVDSRPVSYDFEVEEREKRVEFVLELGSVGGDAAFPLASVRLRRR